MLSRIDKFVGEFRFLSNFYSSPIEYEGIVYPTVEHAYQAAKTENKDQREQIARAKTPGRAKCLGRGVHIRHNWDSIKLDVMRELVLKKFKVHPNLRKKLLNTGDAGLVEGNTWNDQFWGVYKGKGKNWLGRILVETREKIRYDLAVDNCWLDIRR